MKPPEPKNVGGRPRVGTVYWHGDKGREGDPRHGHWDVRITFPSGRRSPPIHLDPKDSEVTARKKAARWTEDAAVGRLKLEADEDVIETVSAYGKRWLDERERANVVSAKDDRQRFRDHVEPELGNLPVVGATKSDIRKLVAKLDDKVRDPAVKFSWKTANHVWALVRSMFKSAMSSKRPELVVRTDDPTDRVAGPDRGEDLDRTYLYPSEFCQLIECHEVSVSRRRLYVLAAYTLSRAGELRALRWDAVDFQRGVIHIRQASDKRETGKTKRTKTGKTRRIPIEPTLLPLLELLHREADGARKVVHVPVSKCAQWLQRDLRTAGLMRPQLYPPPKGDAGIAATWAPLTFHDLRGTGVTWMALRGDDPLKIQQRAGHEQFTTTERYLREAETLGTDGGVPFPPLPSDLLVSSGVSSRRSQVSRISERDTGFEPARRGQEPNTSRHFADVASVEIVKSASRKLAKEQEADETRRNPLGVVVAFARVAEAVAGAPRLAADLIRFARAA